MQITQSRPGPLAADFAIAQVDSCDVFSSSVNRELVCSGQRSRDRWMVTPITRRCAGGRFRGQSLEEGSLLLLDPGGEVFQQVKPGHCQLAVSIPVEQASRIIQAEYQVEPETLLHQWAHVSDPKVSERLERLLQSVLACDSSHAGAAKFGSQGLAARVIAIAQDGAPPRLLRASLAHRRRVVRRAEDMIRGRLDRPPSITELCETTFASRRLLFYAFNELLGRSPAAHIKNLRMHAARRRLVSGKSHASIQQIAFDLGFGHPGQFAIDYARAFGERPSQTRCRLGKRAVTQPVNNPSTSPSRPAPEIRQP
ncbi:MAG: helix-turn-helix domain-containing protein [Wenzhouxiangella sp.]